MPLIPAGIGWSWYLKPVASVRLLGSVDGRRSDVACVATGVFAAPGVRTGFGAVRGP